jgi:hypothetical protein
MQFPQHSKYMLAGSVIQIAGRLIGQQQFGGSDKRPRHRDPLLLASRHFAHFVIHPVRQTDALQHLPRGRRRFLSTVAADEPRHHRVLKRRKLRQQMVELEHETDVTVSESCQFERSPPKDVLVFEQHFTPGGNIQAP